MRDASLWESAITILPSKHTTHCQHRVQRHLTQVKESVSRVVRVYIKPYINSRRVDMTPSLYLIKRAIVTSTLSIHIFT